MGDSTIAPPEPSAPRATPVRRAREWAARHPLAAFITSLVVIVLRKGFATPLSQLYDAAFWSQTGWLLALMTVFFLAVFLLPRKDRWELLPLGLTWPLVTSVQPRRWGCVVKTGAKPRRFVFWGISRANAVAVRDYWEWHRQA